MAARISAVVSTDHAMPPVLACWDQIDIAPPVQRSVLSRPPELAQDDTPMIDVVKHAMREIPGQPEDIWLLVQPTQPLRKPEHLTQAIQVLLDSEADSVVTVVELPQTHHPHFACRIRRHTRNGHQWSSLCPWKRSLYSELAGLPPRRQVRSKAYIRDGTCYAFYRRTVERFGNIYGDYVRPLVIPASETCALDTPEDWAEAERRLLA